MSGPRKKAAAKPPPIPFQQWRYRYIEGIGNNMIIEFVDPTMTGEFHMTMDPSEKDALLYVPGAGLTLMEQMGLSDKTERFNSTDGTHLGQPFGGTPESMNEFTRLEQFAKLQTAAGDQVQGSGSRGQLAASRYNILPMKVRVDLLPAHRSFGADERHGAVRQQGPAVPAPRKACRRPR